MGKKKVRFDFVTMGFIAPAFLFFTLFIIVPTIASVYYSFTSWDGLNPVVKFVGLANYKEIFTSARFGNAQEYGDTDRIHIDSGKQHGTDSCLNCG